MAFSNSGKNLMLDALGVAVTHVSLHSGDPSTTGANEISGGTPAYARQAIDWGAASSGAMAIDGVLTFDVPASTTVSYFGMWSASSGGTFYGGAALDDSEAFTAQGQFVFDTLSLQINN